MNLKLKICHQWLCVSGYSRSPVNEASRSMGQTYILLTGEYDCRSGNMFRSGELRSVRLCE